MIDDGSYLVSFFDSVDENRTFLDFGRVGDCGVRKIDLGGE